jgi:dynein heavy chain
LHDEWDNLDAPAAEKFVDDGNHIKLIFLLAMRILAITNRYFKDKNMTDIQKISEKIRAEIESFRPKVPLFVALKKKGMMDRYIFIMIIYKQTLVSYI